MHRPRYSGPRPAHPPCSPDGSRARTENHLARLYTAILAELVGATGRVTAIEFDGEARRPRYGEFCADAACPRGARRWHANRVEPVDIIYVNAGATRPADAWLDRLKEGGRL